MEKHNKTIGVVLAETGQGENGKRLTLFTKDLGRVTAFASGAKKAKSSLLAGSQLFVFGNFELYRGKNAYTLTGVEVIESFYELRSDLVKTAYAAYFSELMQVFVQDGLVSEEMLKLIYIAFEELIRQKHGADLIRAIYELKLLALAGYSPELSLCVKCGTTEDLLYFDHLESGAVCPKCAAKYDEKMPAAVLQAMQYVIESSVEKVFRFRLGEGYQRGFGKIIKAYLKQYLDYPLKSERFLKEIIM